MRRLEMLEGLVLNLHPSGLLQRGDDVLHVKPLVAQIEVPQIEHRNLLSFDLHHFRKLVVDRRRQKPIHVEILLHIIAVFPHLNPEQVFLPKHAQVALQTFLGNVLSGVLRRHIQELLHVRSLGPTHRRHQHFQVLIIH